RLASRGNASSTQFTMPCSRIHSYQQHTTLSSYQLRQPEDLHDGTSVEGVHHVGVFEQYRLETCCGERWSLPLKPLH
ncbi:MAG: hypothetical protein ABGY41_14280, partial [Candidatus Poribacteria bacterium]